MLWTRLEVLVNRLRRRLGTRLHRFFWRPDGSIGFDGNWRCIYGPCREGAYHSCWQGRLTVWVLGENSESMCPLCKVPHLAKVTMDRMKCPVMGGWVNGFELFRAAGPHRPKRGDG